MTKEILASPKAVPHLNGQSTPKAPEATAVPPDKYQALFNDSPISLWEEDFSSVKLFIEQLRQNGVTDFRAYFDAHPEDVVHCIGLVKVVDVNDRTLKLYKADSKETLLANLKTVFGEEAFGVFKAELIVIGNGGVLFENEGTNYTLDGDPIQVKVRWSVPASYEDTLSRVIVSITDITQRKRAEYELHKAKEYAEQLFQLVPSVIFTVDNDGSITSWNKKATELTGYAPEEIIGNNCRLFAQAPCTNKCGLFANDVNKPIAGAECTIRTKDGRLLTVSKNASLLYDGDGEVIGGIESLEDITERKKAVDQINESFSLLQATLESTADGILVVDGQGKVTRRNQRFLDMWRIPESLAASQGDNELIGYVLAQLEKPELFIAKVRELNDQPDAESFDILHFQDGRIFERFSRPQQINDTIVGRVWSFRDVTAERHAKETLRRQLQEEELLSQIIKLIASADNLTHALNIICEKLAQFLQVPQAAFALVNNEQTESHVIAEYLEPGRPSGLGFIFPREGNPSSEYIFEHKKPLVIADAQNDPIMAPIHNLMRQRNVTSMLIVPIFLNGEVAGTFGFDDPEHREFSADDIDLVQRVAAQVSQALQRKRSEQKLQEQHDFANQVMDNMGQGLVVAKTDWTIEYCNKALAQLLGQQPQDIIGTSALDIVYKANPRIVEIVYKRWMRGKTQAREILIKHADGSPVSVLLTAVPRLRDGQVDGAIAVVTDLSKQKQIEADLSTARDQAIEASRLKSEFLANMSHEIRTPLNAVIGMTSLMLDTPLTAEQQEYALTVRSSGDVLLSLINSILDFSKIEAGKLELEMQSFNLRDCVEEALDVVVAKAAEKGLEMAYIMDDQVPQTIVGDVTRLRQVLVNLLGNAIKFTEQGEVVVRVNSQLISGTDQHEIQFAVKDTGIGIPQNRRNRLFQSFSQVDASTTRKYGGTGLGLTISKRLVEMMDGRIWVESEAGKGSTFLFTIKAKAEVGQRRVYLHGEQPQLDGKRLLIVDDNETNRIILIKQASLWGMTPQAVASGPEALALLRENISFDVAVLDMHMPDMDGLTLATEIRQLRSQKELPLVMLSSVGNREGDEAEKYFSAFLTKPVKQQLLYNSLLSAFGNTAVSAKRAPKKLEIDPEMSKNHPLRILLAEDNLINQKVAIRILERMGYRADVAANGLEALEALQRQSYDVILMDVQMPDMDGVEATEQIRDIWPKAQQPRIIAMTAHALSGDKEKYLRAGMDDYISKPVRIQELMGSLANSQPLSAK